MALTGNQVLLEIASTLDDKGLKDLNKELKKVGVQAEKTGKDGELSLNKLKKSSDFTGKSFIEMAAKGAILAATIKKIVNAANEQAVADAQLELAIKNNTTAQTRQGKSVSDLLKQYKAFAAQRQESANIDDAATEQLMKTLLAMGTAPSELERVTVAFQDMAAGSDMSAEGMARAWGRLQEAPEEALGALTRVGIKINAETLAGMTAEQQRIFILEKLEGKFKGQAAVVAEAQGAYGKFTVQLDEVAEAAGNALLPALSAVLTPITAVLKFFASLPSLAVGAVSAVGGLTVGIMALNGALTLTPVGIIVTAVAAIGGLIGFLDGLSDSTQRYKEIAEELAVLDAQANNAAAFTKKTNVQLDGLSRLTQGTDAYKSALQQMIAMNPALINMGITSASSYDQVKEAVDSLNAKSEYRIKLQRIELLEEKRKLKMIEAQKAVGTSSFGSRMDEVDDLGRQIFSAASGYDDFEKLQKKMRADAAARSAAAYGGAPASTGTGSGSVTEKAAAYDLAALRISLINDEFAKRRAEQAKYYKEELQKINDSGMGQMEKEEARGLLAQKNVMTNAQIEREEQQKTLEALGNGLAGAFDVGTSIIKGDWKSAIGTTLSSISPVLGAAFSSAVGFFSELFGSSSESFTDKLKGRIQNAFDVKAEIDKWSSQIADAFGENAQTSIDVKKSGLETSLKAISDTFTGYYHNNLGQEYAVGIDFSTMTKDQIKIMRDSLKEMPRDKISRVLLEEYAKKIGIDWGQMRRVWVNYNLDTAGVTDQLNAVLELLGQIEDVKIADSLNEYKDQLEDIEHKLKTGEMTDAEAQAAQVAIYDQMIAALQGVAGAQETINKLEEERYALLKSQNEESEKAAVLAQKAAAKSYAQTVLDNMRAIFGVSMSTHNTTSVPGISQPALSPVISAGIGSRVVNRNSSVNNSSSNSNNTVTNVNANISLSPNLVQDLARQILAQSGRSFLK